LQVMLRQALSGFWHDYIAAFKPMVRIGDYAFVHAGVVPGIEIDAQEPAHLRWIREPFLSSENDHGAVIVHGHTIAEAPINRPNRIGIDTGAYLTGNLTAVLLEGDKRWFCCTHSDDGNNYTVLPSVPADA
jgi:serine/threonine protein phosphatase 1